MSEQQPSDRFEISGKITESGKPVITVVDYVTQSRYSLSLEDAIGLSGHLAFAVRATMLAMVQKAREKQVKPENRIVVPGRKR